jgi:hypothetical protein
MHNERGSEAVKRRSSRQVGDVAFSVEGLTGPKTAQAPRFGDLFLASQIAKGLDLRSPLVMA